MGNQRSGRALLCIGIALLAPLATSIAQAAAPAAHWTEAKAAKIVKRDATVRFSPSERAALESELHALVREYIQLENAAAAAEHEYGYGYLPSRLHNLRYRYSTALKAVRAGLPIASARCAGAGAAVRGRFSRFACTVTSERLAIPVAEVTWEDGAIASVVEREPRIVGPLAARLSVRITARSAIAFSQR